MITIEQIEHVVFYAMGFNITHEGDERLTNILYNYHEKNNRHSLIRCASNGGHDRFIQTMTSCIFTESIKHYVL